MQSAIVSGMALNGLRRIDQAIVIGLACMSEEDAGQIQTLNMYCRGLLSPLGLTKHKWGL